MKKTIKNVLQLLGILLLVLMFVFCSQGGSSGGGGEDPVPPPSNGTITVNVINAGAAEGKNCYIGIYADGAAPIPGGELEGLVAVVNLGSATDTSATVFTGGNNYDVWITIDMNGVGNQVPEDGIDMVNNAAYNVTINGNKTVTIDYNDLVVYDAP